MQDDHIRHILKSVAALGVIAIGFAVGLYTWDERRAEIADTGSSMSAIAPAAGSVQGADEIGVAYSLTDHNGAPVTQDTYADSYRLVFFGFTHCPDVCPATLKKISAALNSKDVRSDDLRVLFISTDPGNDTPETMKNYLTPYGKRFTGLTGTKEQVDDAAKNFKAYISRSMGSDGNVAINHSSYVYFFGPGNKLLDVFSADDSPDAMAHAIAELMPQG